MYRPLTYLALAFAIGACPATSFAQSDSPGGKAPAAAEPIKPKAGAAKPAAGKEQPAQPAAAEKPAAKPEAPKPTAEQPAAKQPTAEQPAAKQPTAEAPAAQQPAKPARTAKQVAPEQRTRIRESVRTVGVHPEAHVSFSISVGVRVPHTVHFYPLPSTIVEIVPEYRGYEFFLVGDEIIIVDPETLEIVDVIPA